MTRLRELRERYGYTQDFVAEAINISRITYVRYENDMRNVRGPELKALSDLYHVSVDYILGNEDEVDIPALIDHFNEARRAHDIYIIGSKNSGKTSLINRMLKYWRCNIME